MDKFSEQLEEQFNAILSDEFVKRASYYSAMDFLEYVSRDTTVVADRVDGVLTALLDADTGELIGFRLKGFGHIFNTHVKPLFQLTDEDFLPIVRVLEHYFTQAADSVCDDVDQVRRERVYKACYKLASDDEVTVPADLELAA